MRSDVKNARFAQGELQNPFPGGWGRDAKTIHVILDNYSIHYTQQVDLSLETPEGRD